MSEHRHVFIHVSSHDWLGRPAIICKCACGKTLTPEQIRDWPVGS